MRCCGVAAWSAGAAGVLLLLVPAVLMLLNPIRMLMHRCTMMTENSYMLDMFQREVEGAHISVYVFNVTNADSFLAGRDHNLKMQEVGPFTYAESRRNADVRLDAGIMELQFSPRMRLRFLPERSVARPDRVSVMVPNLALLSASSLLSAYPAWVQQGYSLLAEQLGSQPLVSLPVHSYLWGHREPLVTLANALVPGLIYFDQFGIMDRLYENKTMYKMKVSITDADRFSVKSFKKYILQENWAEHPPLESYEFKDTYEGVSFPPGLTVETPLNVFRIGVCRTLDLEYQKKVPMEYGSDAWQYKISDRTFTKDCSEDDRRCGLLDLSNCTYGIPIVMSRAHFLHADPKLYERIEGIKPDPQQHDSFLLIEPSRVPQGLGVTLATSLALQLNVRLGDVRSSAAAAPFADMLLPVAYIKVVQQDVFGEQLNSVLRVIYVTGPNVLIAVYVLTSVAGAALLACALHCGRARPAETARGIHTRPLIEHLDKEPTSKDFSSLYSNLVHPPSTNQEP